MSVATERYASDNLQLLWIDFVTAPANRKHKRLTCQWEQSQTGLFEQCLILQIKIAHSWQLDGSVIPLRNFSNGAGEKQHTADSLTFAKKICPCLC